MTDVSRCLSFAAASLVVGLHVSTPAYGEESEGHSEYHPNLLALFIGVTSEERRETGLALGIEYERRLSKAFGIGALVEHTFGDIDTTVYAVPFAYHSGPWKVYVAPGLEDSDDGTEGLVRIGAEYGFEAGDWEISPQIDVDFVDGDQAFVFGIVFGKGF